MLPVDTNKIWNNIKQTKENNTAVNHSIQATASQMVGMSIESMNGQVQPIQTGGQQYAQ